MKYTKLTLTATLLLSSLYVAPLSIAAERSEVGTVTATVIPSVGIGRVEESISRFSSTASEQARDNLTNLGTESFKYVEPDDLLCINPLTGNVEIKGKKGDQLKTKGIFNISGESNTLYSVSINTIAPKGFKGNVEGNKKVLGLAGDPTNNSSLLAALSTERVQKFTGDTGKLEVETELLCSKVLPKGNYQGTYSISIDYQ